MVDVLSIRLATMPLAESQAHTITVPPIYNFLFQSAPESPSLEIAPQTLTHQTPAPQTPGAQPQFLKAALDEEDLLKVHRFDDEFVKGASSLF
jgi:hypothetical protein